MQFNLAMPDVMFQIQASDGTFQNHALDVILCDYASDGQYDPGYVYLLLFPLVETLPVYL